MVSKMEVFLTFFILCVIYQSSAQTFTVSDLEFVKLVHRSFCGEDTLCSAPDDMQGSTTNTTTTNTTRNMDSLPVSVPKSINPACCKPCSCNTNSCFDFGNCCPDILDTLPTLKEARKPKMVSCERLSIRAIGYLDTSWVYQLCSPDYTTDEEHNAADIKSRCEERDSYFDLETRLPVIDPITQRVYANKLCARCGFVNESNLIPLIPRVSCYDGDPLGTNITKDDIIQKIYNTEKCDIEFRWPSTQVDFDVPGCRQVETQCNVTGRWKVYDPLIEAACHIYRADYNFNYNNIFCYMCNEIRTLRYCEDVFDGGFGTLSFAAVLDFSVGASSDTNIPTPCSSTQIYDQYKVVCRDLTCKFPRVLQDGTCVNLGGNVTEVAYKLHMKFQTIGVHESTEIDSMVLMISDYATSLLIEWDSLDAAINYEMFYSLEYRTVKHHMPPTSKTTKVITSTTRQPTTAFGIPSGEIPEEIPKESRDVQSVLAVNYVLWKVEWYFRPFTSGYHSKYFLDNILKLDDTNITLTNQTVGKSFGFDLFIVDDGVDQIDITVDPEENIALSKYPLSIQLPKVDLLLEFERKYIPTQVLKHTLICPLITINENEFDITGNSLGVFIAELNRTFDRSTYDMELDNQNISTYSICKDVYLSIIGGYNWEQTTFMPGESGVTPQGVLSVVCACISIVLITLVTYLLFRELRTQPGINNMLLCVYLICAQTFFTFASPQYDTVSEFVCSLLGALTHFFWLMVVFAMNVCCYYMFTVFGRRSASRTNTDSRVSKTIYFTMYCACSSLVFVAINIIVVFVDTDKKETGYGGGLCYISRPEMVGYVFALPLGVVLLINLVFYVTVIVKISRTPTVSSSNKKDRYYFKIYAKLSSITGLTWIFGYLFQFTDQAVFEYIFIILNGGIGVCIFLSFVLNKRVHDLYRERFAGKESTRSNKKRKHQTFFSKTQDSTLSSTSKSNVDT